MLFIFDYSKSKTKKRGTVVKSSLEVSNQPTRETPSDPLLSEHILQHLKIGPRSLFEKEIFETDRV